jgi:hypothetical protein
MSPITYDLAVARMAAVRVRSRRRADARSGRPTRPRRPSRWG